jgi:phospholipid transport system transporter-binding protein
MSAPNLTRVSENQFAVSGELNMQTVPAVARTAAGFLQDCRGDVTIDLSAVSRADSAGLALMVDWLRLARRYQFTLQFKNLPEQLLRIAKVSELHEILPVQNH